MCHMSHVTCHVSPVMCHVSHVKNIFFYISLNKKKNKKKYTTKNIGQSGGASRWRVCYQRGLPRLVLNVIQHLGQVQTPAVFTDLPHWKYLTQKHSSSH